jgi:hypothetical protein
VKLSADKIVSVSFTGVADVGAVVDACATGAEVGDCWFVAAGAGAAVGLVVHPPRAVTTSIETINKENVLKIVLMLILLFLFF